MPGGEHHVLQDAHRAEWAHNLMRDGQAVRPDQPNHLAAGYGATYLVNGLDTAKLDGHCIDVQCRCHDVRSLRIKARASPASPPGAKRMTRTRRPPKMRRRYSLMKRNISGSSVRRIAVATTPRVDLVPPITTIAMSATERVKTKESGTMNWVK